MFEKYYQKKAIEKKAPAQIKVLEEDISKISNQIKEIEAIYEEIQKYNQEAKTIEKRIIECTSKKQQLTAECNSLSKSIDGWQRQLVKLQKEKSEIAIQVNFT